MLTGHAADGTLTPVAGSPFSAGSGPGCMAPDPEGKFLYVANFNFGAPGSSNISAYTIDAGTGALTPIAGSPFAAGGAPSSIVIGPQ